MAPLKTILSPTPRPPTFMADARVSISEATFGTRGGLTGQRRVVPLLENSGARRMSEPTEHDVQSLAPPLPPPPPTPGPEFAARLAQAVAELRAHSAELAAQAEADIVEVAAVIARRVLEMELTTGTAALFSLVRSAVRRLGESRKIVVRMCPADAAAVQAAGEASPLRGLAIAKVEVMSDSTLSPGDVIVDGEHGTVDGRLSTRLDEVRRVVTSALAEPEGQP